MEYEKDCSWSQDMQEWRDTGVHLSHDILNTSILKDLCALLMAAFSTNRKVLNVAEDDDSHNCIWRTQF